MLYELPERIKSIIGNEQYSIDDIGMSRSTVILFKDMILKIQDIEEESENEYVMMKWLQNKLPVPRIIAFERDKNKNYLLMSKISGEMACDDKYMQDPEVLTTVLAQALKSLWTIDISTCPYASNLDKKLKLAEYRVNNNLVNIDDVNPETFGENGFKDPKDLLQWLINNRPEEELVLSHGDFCLPNVFIKDGKLSGFIDLGRAGAADKWQDIALCYRSLCSNFNGEYFNKAYEGFNKDMLFKKLGLEPEWEKIN